MSQRDLLAEIRAASTPAPGRLRERVRLLEPPPPPRRLAWRRVLAVGIPVAAAAAAIVVAVVLTRQASHPVAADRAEKTLARAPALGSRSAYGAATGAAVPAAPRTKAFTVPTSPGRLQDVTATLALHEHDQAALSAATRRAVAVATSLGGHANSVHVREGAADLVLAIPRGHLQGAVGRLSALGTITDEGVDVQDVTAGVNATDRTIARLQRHLKALRAQPATVETQRRIAALTRQVEGLQRAQAAARLRAHFAIVWLSLSTAKAAAVPHRTHHGPLHGLAVAFRWTGIGLVYALAFGVPLALIALAVQQLRRRREDALLSRA